MQVPSRKPEQRSLLRPRARAGIDLAILRSIFPSRVLRRYIPSHLAYGDSGRVPGCLVFTMEILKINGGSKPKVKKDD